MMITDLEKELRSLLTGEFSSLTIGFNDDAAPNYQTLAEFEEVGATNLEWVSEEEHRRALDQNSTWTIQWYPNTPVGFYCVAASSLEAVVEAAIKHRDSMTD